MDRSRCRTRRPASAPSPSANDPQLPVIATPNGRLEFSQVVGLTTDEYDAAQDWDTDGLLAVFRRYNRLLITDLSRTSVLDDPDVAREVTERTAPRRPST